MQDFEAGVTRQAESQTAGVVMRTGGALTNEEVPLGVQVGLVGQAAPHHVAAVVAAGPDGGQPAAVGAVHHLGQGRAAAWEHVHLQDKREKGKKRSLINLSFIAS